MTTTGVSNAFIQLQTMRLIGKGQSDLSDLQQQLSSGLKTSDLSQLGTTDSRRLLDLRGDQASRTAYTQVINILQPRVDAQNSILDNMQTLITQIQQSVNTAPTLAAATQNGVPQQVSDALNQVTAYLNERVDDRYLFSGSRYSTKPVTDLTALPVPPTEAYPFTPATPTGNPALASYDTQYNASSYTATQTDVTSVAADSGTSSFTLGSNTWAALGYQVGDTVTFGGLSTAGNNTTYTITGLSNGVATVTPAPTTMAADTTLTATRTPSSTAPESTAWQSDSTAIDEGLTATYGISSNNPGFQNMVMGMRWALAATQDPANYDTYMQRATDLLNTAKTQVRGVEAANSANAALLTKTKASHTTFIDQLKTGQQTIQGADSNEVAAKITLLQSQIEASYAVTSRISQLSLINYLS